MQIYTPLGASSYSPNLQQEQKQLLVWSCLAILSFPSCSAGLHFVERTGGATDPSACVPRHAMESRVRALSRTLPSQVWQHLPPLAGALHWKNRTEKLWFSSSEINVMLKRDELDLLHLLKNVFEEKIQICIAKVLKNTVRAENAKKESNY